MSTYSQMFPPKPVFTEKDIPILSGKVFLVTGGYSGVGLEVCRALYHKGGRVIIAGRSESSYTAAVEEIRGNCGDRLTVDLSTPGSLEFLCIDLADLTTIKPAVEKMLENVKRLDVVWYNAGVMVPPAGSKTKQGYELQWGTNVVGHFLLHKLLCPLLTATAAGSEAGTVRAIFVSSIMHTYSPKPYGIDFDSISRDNEKASKMAIWNLYSQSKAGDVLLADEYAKRSVALAPVSNEDPAKKKPHVVSISLNPGNLKTNLQRHSTGNKIKEFLVSMILHEQSLGGLTELYAGLAPETADYNGGYVVPFGRKGSVVSYVKKGLTSEGTGAKLWEILEEEVKDFA
ncbi:hypothetical protein BZA70DRAFT_283103 [Myxozyma melibiosi]|uniref:NAD(P)-binding protein n=1 Tax=Myxozyma melibiosi TaxID=54550 RepID=A0ABR1F1F0_9ASCO